MGGKAGPRQRKLTGVAPISSRNQLNAATHDGHIALLGGRRGERPGVEQESAFRRQTVRGIDRINLKRLIQRKSKRNFHAFCWSRETAINSPSSEEVAGASGIGFREPAIHPNRSDICARRK